jgi:hypothetical protein
VYIRRSERGGGEYTSFCVENDAAYARLSSHLFLFGVRAFFVVEAVSR